jgi:hypothetical protein
MQMIVRLLLRRLLFLLCSVSLAVFAATANAREKGDDNIDWPSPDGKFAFVTSGDEYSRKIELIDRKSGTRSPIAEEESGQASFHALWAPDSNRFALMTRVGHPIQGVDVYFRTGETFEKVALPELPAADVPEKLKQGKKFPHFAGLNWQAAEKWHKDGSLVVTIVTMVDGGDGGSITATRTVEIGFDSAGHAKITKSSIKYMADRQ